MELKWFKDEEFRKAVPSCSLSDMDEEFMHHLDECRDFAGISFVINSAYRSVEYEKSKGRSGQVSIQKDLPLISAVLQMLSVLGLSQVCLWLFFIA